MCFRLTTLIFAAAMTTASSAQAEAELLMVEEAGCVWCARWNAEIGPIYPKTGEGAAAPLRRYDIATALPSDATLARAVTFTPTFVLLVDGTEAQRVEGYPGEDFFWGLLGTMLDNAAVPYEIKTSPGGPDG